MRLLIGLLALVPVGVLAGTLLRSRLVARAGVRRARQSEIDHLLRERQEIEEEKTIANLQRELDVARARQEKKGS